MRPPLDSGDDGDAYAGGSKGAELALEIVQPPTVARHFGRSPVIGGAVAASRGEDDPHALSDARGSRRRIRVVTSKIFER